MTKQRIPETNQGITGDYIVNDYDNFQRDMRDRSLMETFDIIKSGINSGKALEIGPGPGYLGLEWLKNTRHTSLCWLEISEDMKRMALKNAAHYNLQDRVTLVLSNATTEFPFNDSTFDAVFTNGSLHEWENPINVFNEIDRVLNIGGRFFISDLKRNINPILRFIMKSMTKKPSMKEGFITSVNAAYVKKEIRDLLLESKLDNFSIKENPFGLTITGMKK
jgi:ubiquinone/menaquinone biosynthesis C-methylase UbiE